MDRTNAIVLLGLLGFLFVCVVVAIGWRWRWVRIATWVAGLLASLAAIGGGLALVAAVSGGEPDSGHEAIDGYARGMDNIGKIIFGVPGVLLIGTGLFGLIVAIKATRDVLGARPPRRAPPPTARVVE